MILALVALCVGIVGAGAVYRSRGVPGEIQFLFQAVAGLSEKSQEHDEKIRLIVAHIRDLKASLCDFHSTEPMPDFCGPDQFECVPGICDSEFHDPCIDQPGLCDDDGG